MKQLIAVAAGLAAAGCGSAAPSGGTPTVPAPVSRERATPGAVVLYRARPAEQFAVHRRDSLVLELSAAPQTQTFERTAYVRVAVTDASGGSRVVVSLDSLRTEPGSAVPRDSLAPPDGSRWTATLSPTGLLTDIVASDTSPVSDRLRSVLPLLFPRLPDGGARVGASWSDTTDSRLRVNAFDAKEQAIVHSRATALDGQGAGRTLTIESDGTYTQTGKGSPFGQPMEMRASGTRHGIAHLGLDGALLDAEGSDTGDLTINVPEVGQSVPAHRTSSYRITALSRAPR